MDRIVWDASPKLEAFCAQQLFCMPPAVPWKPRVPHVPTVRLHLSSNAQTVSLNMPERLDFAFPQISKQAMHFCFAYLGVSYM